MIRENPLSNVGIVSIALLCTSPGLAQDTLEIGAGTYHSDVPAGRERPSDSSGQPVSPRLSDQFQGPVPTNDWSSSIGFPRYAANAHGEPMFPWPFSAQFSSQGVRLNASPELFPGNGGYFAYFNSEEPDLVVGMTGFNAVETRLAEAEDWSITAELTDGTRQLHCTLVRGLPFAGFKLDGAQAELRTRPGTTIINQAPGHIIFQSGGSIFGAFAPDRSEWLVDGTVIRSQLGAGQWFNLATLPDSSDATIDLFLAHAAVEVTGTKVSWNYDPQAARVEATYSFETVVHAGNQNRVLTGLLPHQQLHCNESLLGLSYQTARGRLELVSAETFTLSLPIAPILPGLPAVELLDREEIKGLLAEIDSEDNPISAPDSYWAGKQLGRLASAAQTANDIGESQLRDRFIQRLKLELEDWFSTGTSAHTNRIEAELHSAQSGTEFGAGEDGGSAVSSIGGGDFMRYDGVNLGGTQPSRVLVRYASGVGQGGSALIRLRLDNPDGPIIAEAAIGNTGGWSAWTTVPLGVASETGVALDGTRPLFFSCETGYPGDVLALEWIEWDLPGSGGTSTKDLAYCPEWTTLLAHPGSYGMAGELNDHHFHYGYFISAAATIARFDPVWASPERWGGMVDLLIKDAANWDRGDQRFPFLRNFEPYAGHAYASGHAGFAAGNNQESSSESTHFAQAVVLWGEATGRSVIRDLGLYLHALETQAIEQYWFDADQAVYPPGSEHPLAGIVWDSGATYATWWTGNPEEIQGINLLPITGGSFYLGRRAEAMERAWSHLLEQNGGPPVEWRDVIWAWRALVDPAGAEAWLESESAWTSEPGHSQAFITYWIRSLAKLGVMQHQIVSDSPTAAVFELDGIRSYVAHNGSNKEREVRFSDDTRFCVGPGQTLVSHSPSVCSTTVADLDGDGFVDGSDLTLLIGSWGSCDTGCAADFDGDGVVGGTDLTRLLSEWG
jgi:endoglucanase Acf2